jgi:hypothetical protein
MASFALTREECDAFRTNGYLGPFDLCTPARMAEIRGQLDALIGTIGLKHGFHQVHNRHLDLRLVHDLAAGAPIVERMASLYGSDLLLWRTNFFTKQPGDPAIPWHQDYNYWPLEPPVIISAWLAIDRATIANSCVQIIPGSHRKILSHVKGQVVFGEQADPNGYDASKAINMELEAGQFFLFNERTLHHSEPNTSNERRMGLAIRAIIPIVKVVKYDSEAHGLVQLCGGDPLGLNRIVQPPPA